MIEEKPKWAFKVYRKKSWEIAKSGLYPVVIEWSYGMKQTHALSITVRPEQWNKTFQRLNAGTGPNVHPNALKYNKELDRLATDINSIIDDFHRRNVPFVNDMILEKLLHPVSKMKVYEYICYQMENFENVEAFGRADNLKELLEYLQKFDDKLEKRMFPEINLDYIKRFVNKQKEASRKLGGISNNLRCLRRILNLAIGEGVGSPETYPFSNKYGTMIGKETFSIEKELSSITRKRYVPKSFLVKFRDFIFPNRAHARLSF